MSDEESSSSYPSTPSASASSDSDFDTSSTNEDLSECDSNFLESSWVTPDLQTSASEGFLTASENNDTETETEADDSEGSFGSHNAPLLIPKSPVPFPTLQAKKPLYNFECTTISMEHFDRAVSWFIEANDHFSNNGYSETMMIMMAIEKIDGFMKKSLSQWYATNISAGSYKRLPLTWDRFEKAALYLLKPMNRSGSHVGAYDIEHDIRTHKQRYKKCRPSGVNAPAYEIYGPTKNMAKISKWLAKYEAYFDEPRIQSISVSDVDKIIMLSRGTTGLLQEWILNYLNVNSESFLSWSVFKNYLLKVFDPLGWFDSWAFTMQWKIREEAESIEAGLNCDRRIVA